MAARVAMARVQVMFEYFTITPMTAALRERTPLRPFPQCKFTAQTEVAERLGFQ
jgi:hypothetical protein